MSIVSIGIDHRSAPLALLEKLVANDAEQAALLTQLNALDGVGEVALITTCNRFELYVQASRFHAVVDGCTAWLADRADTTAEHVADVARIRLDAAAATHLFRVAAGLESVVLGEPQIATQVRRARDMAADTGTMRAVLERLFDDALRLQKIARATTGLGGLSRSMVDAGFDALTHIADEAVVGVLGAGVMGAVATRTATARGHNVVVWNRSAERLAGLAGRDNVTTTTDLHDVLGAADIIVATTAGAGIVTAAKLSACRPQATPLQILDLGLPRNIEASCADMDHVELIDIDVLRQRVAAGDARNDLHEAEQLIDDAVVTFDRWWRAREVEPVIAALRAQLHDARVAELDRRRTKIDGLGPAGMAVVDQITRAAVNAVLHEPTMRLKELAATGDAAPAASAIRDLFALRDGAEMATDTAEQPPLDLTTPADAADRPAHV